MGHGESIQWQSVPFTALRLLGACRAAMGRSEPGMEPAAADGLEQLPRGANSAGGAVHQRGSRLGFAWAGTGKPDAYEIWDRSEQPGFARGGNSGNALGLLLQLV